jgi:hypothetical protein
MDLIQNLFVAWVVICVLILGLSIYNLSLGLQNKRDIQKMQNL